MSVSVPEFITLAATPGISVVRESVWVESAANKMGIVTLVHGEWSVNGIDFRGGGGQQFWVNGWDSSDFWHFTAFASVTVPVFITVVVQWVNGGAGPEKF
jgi:hypothetical protein